MGRSAVVVILLLCAACAPAATPPPTATPTLTPPLALGEERCPPPPGWTTYVVQPGDTLRELADATGSTVDELAAANCLQNPTTIDTGAVLNLPREP